ncbi:MAG: tRNA pseudouridine(55) synthase TruB [Anaerolineaceae bacterium]
MALPGSDMDGILVIDKPAGWTSHDVVAKTRGITRQRRIGHTGTLDPMATGVLVLCLGRATRLVEYMTRHDKRYNGEITLGVTTDTDDAEGAELTRATVPTLTDLDLRRLETAFTGQLLQRPPAYSAIKVDGKRAYAIARAGEAFELRPRPVTIHELRLTWLAVDRLGIQIHCGPGTYVRSIARDIGQMAECGGHLAALRRTAVGDVTLADATTMEALPNAVTDGSIATLLLQPDEGVANMQAVILRASQTTLLRSGAVVLSADRAFVPSPVARIYDTSGAFAGIGSVLESGQIRAMKLLNLEKESPFH